MPHFAQIGHKIPTYIKYFLGVRGLTTSFYTVYDYTTSGHTDLLSILQFYAVYMHFYTIYLFISNAIKNVRDSCP